MGLLPSKRILGCPPAALNDIPDHVNINSSLGIIWKFATHIDLIDFFQKHANTEGIDWRSEPWLLEGVPRHLWSKEQFDCYREYKKSERRALSKRQRRSLSALMRGFLAKYGLAARKGFKTLFNCGKFAIPAKRFDKKRMELVDTGFKGQVTAHFYPSKNKDDPVIGYAGLQVCGNPMFCFDCAPKVRYLRSKEVEFICNSMYEKGYTWIFVTFTTPHDVNADPIAQVHNFNEAMRVFKSGDYTRKYKQVYNIDHQIRAAEMTDDHPNSEFKTGCHYHHHDLIFMKRDPLTGDEADVLAFEWAFRWVNSLIKNGLCKDDPISIRNALIYSVKIELPRNPKDPSADVGKYLSKFASMEMTPGIFVKQGRSYNGVKRISFYELIVMCLYGRHDLDQRVLNMILALQESHWLRCSPGLKNFVGLEELSDQQLLEGVGSLPVHIYDTAEWLAIERYKGRGLIVDSVANDLREAGIEIEADASGEIGEDVVNFVKYSVEDANEAIICGFDPTNGENIKASLFSDIGIKNLKIRKDLLDQE